jgi:hypothetical protein
MTGQIPREIEELVINQPELLQVIEVPDGADSGLSVKVSL